MDLTPLRYISALYLGVASKTEIPVLQMPTEAHAGAVEAIGEGRSAKMWYQTLRAPNVVPFAL